MHYYPYFATGDSSHPNSVGQYEIMRAVMNALNNGVYSFFLAESEVQITAPATQRIAGKMYQSVYGEIVQMRTSGLVMHFDTPAE